MTDDLGLNVDMLDVDRLRDWARLIERDTQHTFIAHNLSDLAGRLEQEIRDVGELRKQLREAQSEGCGVCGESLGYGHGV